MKKHITGDLTIPNINITIELCDEDRKRLDDILAALQDKTGYCMEKHIAEPKPEGPETAKEAPEEPQPAETENEPKQEAPQSPEIPLAELQSKVVQLVGAGKKEATRAIVTQYAKSVGEIPEDKRAEVLERLNALEG